eukprot:749291-Hanusia_phi.AAC.9
MGKGGGREGELLSGEERGPLKERRALGGEDTSAGRNRGEHMRGHLGASDPSARQTSPSGLTSSENEMPAAAQFLARISGSRSVPSSTRSSPHTHESATNQKPPHPPPPASPPSSPHPPRSTRTRPQSAPSCTSESDRTQQGVPAHTWLHHRMA